MKKEFRTITYGAKIGDGAMRLKLDTDKSILAQKNIEIKARVDLDSGEVTFFVKEEDLQRLRRNEI